VSLQNASSGESAGVGSGLRQVRQLTMAQPPSLMCALSFGMPIMMLPSATVGGPHHMLRAGSG